MRFPIFLVMLLTSQAVFALVAPEDDMLFAATAVETLCCCLEFVPICAIAGDFPGALKLLNWVEARTDASDYRLGTRCIAPKTVLGITVTPIDWSHTSTRNCATLAWGAGRASGIPVPSAFDTWSGFIGGFSVTYNGDMPYVLYGRL